MVAGRTRGFCCLAGAQILYEVLDGFSPRQPAPRSRGVAVIPRVGGVSVPPSTSERRPESLCPTSPVNFTNPCEMRDAQRLFLPPSCVQPCLLPSRRIFVAVTFSRGA